MQRKICSEITAKFSENAAINLLSENESYSGYQRKRLQQSFEYVNTPKAKRCRNNEDSFEKFSEIV